MIKELKTIKFDPASADTYEITDAAARGRLTTVENTVSGIPTTYATKTEIANKQDQLVSGVNIKTINNKSLLGSGNINIEGGGGGSSELPVFEPQVIVSSKTWNEVIEAGLDNFEFGGIGLGWGTPDSLLVDPSGSWTVSFSDATITTNANTVNVTVGESSVDLYENNSWISDTTITDANSDVSIFFNSSERRIEFNSKSEGDSLFVNGSAISTSSLKNMSENVSLIIDYYTRDQFNTTETAANIDFTQALIYGLQSNDAVTSPAELIKSGGSSWSLSNSAFSIDVSTTSFVVTVGSTSEILYNDGAWTDTQDGYVREHQPWETGFQIHYQLWMAEEGKRFITLRFENPNEYVLEGQDLSSTDATYIEDNILFATSITPVKQSSSTQPKYVVNGANITATAFQFNSTYANNLNSAFSIGYWDTNITLGTTEATVTINSTQSAFYENGAWVASGTLNNGCVWDADTHKLQLPTGTTLHVSLGDTGDLNSPTEEIQFIAGSEVSFELPDPADYADQMAEIKDTVNNVSFVIYSTGTAWKFASDVLQLSESQYTAMAGESTSKSLYGISLLGKYCLSPYDGLPYKLQQYGWESNFPFEQKHNSFSANNSVIDIRNFSTTTYNVTQDLDTVTCSVMPDVYSATLCIKVTDTAPTITFTDSWSTGATFVFKQDGTATSALDFSTTNTYYVLNFVGSNFNENYVIFVDCQSYAFPA